MGRGGSIMFYIKDSIRCIELQLAYNFDIECIILDVFLFTTNVFYSYSSLLATFGKN